MIVSNYYPQFDPSIPPTDWPWIAGYTLAKHEQRYGWVPTTGREIAEFADGFIRGTVERAEYDNLIAHLVRLIADPELLNQVANVMECNQAHTDFERSLQPIQLL